MRAPLDMTNVMSNPSNSISEECKAIRMLLEILKREQAQLIEANINELTELTEEKTRLLELVSTLANSRYTALAKAGVDPNEAGMRRWLESNSAVEAHHSWQELLSTAQTANEVNRINGLLIGKHLARTQNSLNILRGSTPSNSFYGPDGQSTQTTATRTVVVG